MNMIFHDRADAGRRLGERLLREDTAGCIVLALPRGGVPVGYEAARILKAPLDVVIVRKLGVPGHEELAMGAIASGGVRVLNDEVLRHLPHARAAIEIATEHQLVELRRREAEYRSGRPPLEIEGKSVILVDDGLATGATMRAATVAVKERGASRIMVAVPVGAPDTCEILGREVDQMICLLTPEFFQAVGQFYADFSQTTDDEVRAFLSQRNMVPEPYPSGV
jgi:predicted phosphoribosyltransferase